LVGEADVAAVPVSRPIGRAAIAEHGREGYWQGAPPCRVMADWVVQSSANRSELRRYGGAVYEQNEKIGTLMNISDGSSTPGLLARLFMSRHERAARAQAARIYGRMVEAARQPLFYAALGVPDTLEGRFDLIVLHLCLVLRRLRAAEGGTLLAQKLFDRFCQDMDGNLREMGVGDLAVPKRMRKFGEAFYGRAAAYDTALDQDDPAALAQALARNVYGTEPSDPAAQVLAHEVRRMSAALTALSDEVLVTGDWSIPAVRAAGGEDAPLVPAEGGWS